MSASKSGYPSTAKSAPTTTNFSKGLNTYLPNDVLEYEQVRIAQNVRFDKIGEYITRKGLNPIVKPVGYVKYPLLPPVTPPSYAWVNANELPNVPIHLSHPSNKVFYSMTFRVKLPTDVLWKNPERTLRLVVKDGPFDGVNSTTLGVYCTKCTIPPALVPQPVADVTFTFMNGVDTTEETPIYCTIDDQDDSNVLVQYAALTESTTPNMPYIVEYSVATSGFVESVFESNIHDHKQFLFSFVHGGVRDIYACEPSYSHKAYKITTEYSGATTPIRFMQIMDAVYYTTGDGAPVKLTIPDPDVFHSWHKEVITTEDLQTGVDLEIKTSNLMVGTQDNIIYFDADTTTQAVWTNPYGLQWVKGIDYTTTAAINPFVVGETTTTTISTSTMEPTNEDHLVANIEVGDVVVDENDNYGEVTTITGQNITLTSISHMATAINSYDKFDRDFHQNFPSINTGDPLTAMFNLGGVVYFLTRKNKYYMFSQTADVWTQQTSAAQHGTYSQESVVCDLNYAYYANDDGIYVFNGSTETSLTEKTIQDVYDKIKGDGIRLELYNNRLYVFCSDYSNEYVKFGNNRCLVYNINLKIWESLDTFPYASVSSSAARKTVSNQFVCGSGAFGQLLSYEKDVTYDQLGRGTYDYTYSDLGMPINMDIATGYLHFGTPSQLHRITKWRPEFAKTSYPCTVRCGYATDFTDQVKYSFSVKLDEYSFWNDHRPWESEVWDNAAGYGNSQPTKLTTIPKVYSQFRRCQILYQHHAAFEPVNFKSHTLCVQTQRIR